jgi:GTPase
LNQRIVELALSSIGDVDVVLLIADVNKPDHDSEKILVKTLSETNKPVILAINKIDRQKSLNIASIMEQWSSIYSFEAIVPISAKFGFGIEKLLDALLNLLPPGPPFFSEDTLTDMPMRLSFLKLSVKKFFVLPEKKYPILLP